MAESGSERSSVGPGGMGRRPTSAETAFALGQLSSEFGNEGLALVDRSNAASLRTDRLPPHGPHMRAVHPHGDLRDGSFVASGEAAEYSSAAHLVADGRAHPATVRFSNFIRRMHEPDLMGLAVKIDCDGEIWDMAATSVSHFVAGNIAAFRAINEVATIAWWKPRKLRILGRAILSGASVPGLVKLKLAQLPYWPGRPKRCDATYWGVHTFWLHDDDDKRPFKYRWEPTAKRDGFHLYFDLIDPTWEYIDDAAKPTPPRVVQRAVWAGTLTLGPGAGCKGSKPDAVRFDPTRLPFGIGPGDDEILFMRRGAYSESYLRRAPR